MTGDLPDRFWQIYILTVAVLTLGIVGLTALTVGPDIWRGAQQTLADWRAGVPWRR